MDKAEDAVNGNIELGPVAVVSQTFPARPSSIPDIRDFVRHCLDQSPLPEERNRDVGETVSQALLEAAGPAGAISVSFRIFPGHVEVDVLRLGPQGDGASGLDAETWLTKARGQQAARPATPPALAGAGEAPDGRDQAPADRDQAPAGGDPALTGGDQVPASFAEWISGMLRREGMTIESAAKQLGVSAKTVSRWVGGSTEPRLRDLRRIREVFGEIPFL